MLSPPGLMICLAFESLGRGGRLSHLPIELAATNRRAPSAVEGMTDRKRHLVASTCI